MVSGSSSQFLKNFSVIGLSHKSAPIDVREKFYFSDTQQALLLSTLKSEPSVVEAMVLSTCNRTEVYITSIAKADDLVWQALCNIKQVDPAAPLRHHFHTYTADAAVIHFFRVAAGLDSLIIGERQILGQVKAATKAAREKGMMGRTLNILSNLAIRVGKKAHHETHISAGGVSVSWAAVAAAQQEFETLADRSVLLIGTGKMGHLAASYLNKKNVGKLYVMNRTEEKAIALAKQVGGSAVPFWEIAEILPQMDVCICSIGAPHYIVEKDLVAKAMTKRPSRRLVCVDISMPRNIDPRVAQINNVSLTAIDDLNKIVENNVSKRQAAVAQVEAMINAKVEQFFDKIQKATARQGKDGDAGKLATF